MYYLKTNAAGTSTPKNLGELIMAINDSAKNQNEAVATVVNLLESGRVRVTRNGKNRRAKVIM